MGELCQKLIAPGRKNNEITPLLAKIAEAYGVNLVPACNCLNILLCDTIRTCYLKGFKTI